MKLAPDSKDAASAQPAIGERNSVACTAIDCATDHTIRTRLLTTA